MKIVDAQWEIRNIGLKTLEIIFEDGSEMLPIQQMDSYQYIVSKVQSKEIKTIHLLEKNGFEFIESQLIISKFIKGIKFDPFLARIASGYKIIEVETLDQLNIILHNINIGLFDTDRIYLDPILGKEKSINRYKNWVTDIYNNKNNHKIFIISKIKNDIDVGFISFKKKDKENCEIPLVGIFEEYKKMKIGFLTVYFPLLYALNNEFKFCHTAISLNNLNAVNLYSIFGYQIDKTFSVLRKINQ